MTIYRYAEYAVAICIVTYRPSTRQSPASRRDLSLFRNVLIITDVYSAGQVQTVAYHVFIPMNVQYVINI